MASLAAPIRSTGNVTITYDGVTFQAHVRDTNYGVDVASEDTTTLASTAASETPTSENYTLSVEGFWGKAVDDKLGADAVAPPATLKTLEYVVGPTGNTITYTWTTNAFVQSYEVTAASEELIRFSAEFGLSGSPTIS